MNAPHHISTQPGPLRWRWLVAAMCLAMLVACSEDDDSPTTPIGPANGDSEDAGDVFDPDADASPSEDVEEDTGEDTGDPDANGNGNGNGEDPDPQLVEGPCGTMLEMGQLAEGEHEVVVDFADYDTGESTGCTVEGEEGDAAILSFELKNRANFSFFADVPVGMELRFDHCVFSSQRFACHEEGMLVPTTFGPPEAYLIVEQLAETGTDIVEITLELDDPPVCDDEGDVECVDQDSARVCRLSWTDPDVPRWMEGPCPAGCDEGCVGDSCDNPLEVSSGDVIEFDNWAFYYHYNHSNHPEPSCEIESTVNPTEGRELVMLLSDLEAGDEVLIDIEAELGEYEDDPDGWPFVVVKDTCSEEAACLGLWTEFDDILSFSVPDDGDYFVMVDSSWHKMDGYFEISVDVVGD